MDDLDELELPPSAVRLIAKAIRAAFRKGQRSVESRFDRMLGAHLREKQLHELNGTTEVFKHTWQESQHKRDHGKFAKKEGGKSDGDTVAASSGTDSGIHGGVGAGGEIRVSTGLRGNGQAPEPIPESHLLDGLHADVPTGLWSQVVSKVKSAAQRVHERLVLATPALLKFQDLLTFVGDHPDDLKRFGYKPVTSGVAGHDTPDALRDATGIGGTLGARLAAHVLARVVSWIRTQSAVGKAADDSDPYAELGSALADALAILAEEFGGEAPDGAAVATALHWIEERAGKFGCAMVRLQGPVVQHLKDLNAQIRDEDLGEDGREEDPHVTVRYGLHTLRADDLRPVLDAAGPVSMKFGHPTFFAGAESGKDYDVIILPVDSPDLHQLHDALGELPHTDTHPDYKPHATVAYVKAGLGEKYIQTLGYPRTAFREVASEVIYSNREKVQTTLPLPVEPVGKAWKSDEHPRGDDGRFIDAHDLHAALTDPAKAAELRKRVTKPEERKKLDEAIGAEPEGEEKPKGNKEPHDMSQSEYVARHPIPEATLDNLDGIAGRLRNAIETAHDGNPKDSCIAAAMALKTVYPEAEVWEGNYRGEPHVIAKIADKYIDVTADQFESNDDVQILDELPPHYKRYQRVEDHEAEVSFRKWPKLQETTAAFREELAELSATRHEIAVRVAHSQGKPVPPEVLADYPDLAPKPAPVQPSAPVPKVPATDSRAAAAREMDEQGAADLAQWRASRKGALNLSDPAAVSAAVRSVAASLPAWNGDAYDSSTPYPHKVYLSHVYNALKSKLPSGTTLDDFKAALSAHGTAGHVRLSPIDMPQFSRDAAAHAASETRGDLRAIEVSPEPTAPPTAPAGNSAPVQNKPTAKKPSVRSAKSKNEAPTAKVARLLVPPAGAPPEVADAFARIRAPFDGDAAGDYTTDRQVAGRVASAWLQHHVAGNGAVAAALEPVLAGLGVERHGDLGATVPFDGRVHESKDGVSTGAPVRVVRHGWLVKGDPGEPLVRTLVEKV